MGYVDVAYSGGTGRAPCPLECEIFTLTVWALYEKNETKSKWSPLLSVSGGAVPLLAVVGFVEKTQLLPLASDLHLAPERGTERKSM